MGDIEVSSGHISTRGGRNGGRWVQNGRISDRASSWRDKIETEQKCIDQLFNMTFYYIRSGTKEDIV